MLNDWRYGFLVIIYCKCIRRHVIVYLTEALAAWHMMTVGRAAHSYARGTGNEFTLCVVPTYHQAAFIYELYIITFSTQNPPALHEIYPISHYMYIDNKATYQS